MIICTDCIHQDVCGLEGSWDEALVSCADKVELPTKEGYWIDKGSLSCRCSECGSKNNKETLYCPNCGCKMIDVAIKMQIKK